ncbi:MAG: choice-of-anchor Q domain-containing protein [Rudaea sp.]
MNSPRTAFKSRVSLTPLASALAIALGVGSIGADVHAGTTPHDSSGHAAMHALRQELAQLKQQLQTDPRVIAWKQRAHHRLVPKPAGVQATVAVSSCVDDPNSATTAGTLRYAVINASDGETIDLSSLSCSTVTLTQGALPVSVDSLTVTGPSVGTFVIDGSGRDRVFDHSGNGTLELDFLNLRNGYTSYGSQPPPKPQSATQNGGAQGGCVYSPGTVNLDHTVVSGCTASSTDASSTGGGVAAYQLYLESSTISGNTAIVNASQGASFSPANQAVGGGAYAHTATVSKNSTISGNRAQASEGFARGGGLGASYVSIADSLVSGNIAQGAYVVGGGVAAYHGLNLSGTTLSGNTAYGTLGTADGDPTSALTFGGGAISKYGLQMQTSTVTGNIARTGAGGGPAGGGGIVAGNNLGGSGRGGPTSVSRPLANSGQISVSYSTIDNNQADIGGGVYFKYAMNLIQSTVSGNSAQLDGGGIELATASSSYASYFYNSTIANNSAGSYAGGVSLYYASLTMQSTIVAVNRSPTGADIYFYLDNSSTSGTLTGSGVQQVSALTIGGSHNLVMDAVNVTLPDDTLSQNPLLLNLVNNGGPTRTMLPGASSPAFETGSNANNYIYDQRGTGFPRSAAGLTNIGSVQTAAAVAAAAPTPTPTLSTWAMGLLGGLLCWVGLRRRKLPVVDN